MAEITVRWNIVRHFYPYYEEDSLDWDNQLERYVQKAVQMAGVNSFESLVEWYDTLCRFMNPVKDGHMFVRRDMNVSGIMSTYLPEFYAEAETKAVNDTLLVMIGTDGKQPWRILHAVNGQQVSERLLYCRQITNAATEAHRDKMAVERCCLQPNTARLLLFRLSMLWDRHMRTLYMHGARIFRRWRGKNSL